MNRRQLLKTLGLGAVAAPLAVFAGRPPVPKPLLVYSDDENLYEQGIFNPTLMDSSVPYEMRAAHYQRVGNLVFVTGTIELQP